MAWKGEDLVYFLPSEHSDLDLWFGVLEKRLLSAFHVYMTPLVGRLVRRILLDLLEISREVFQLSVGFTDFVYEGLKIKVLRLGLGQPK